MTLSEKIYDTLEKLVSIPGISGTESENLTSEKIYCMLSEMPYFKNNKQNFGIEDIDEDLYRRKFVWAIVEGKEKSSNTLILTGHSDVVGIEEFGHLKSIAFNIKECTKRISELNLDKEALLDFESGEWIFGRGTSDMKYGIALDIEIIREFSKERSFKGNLLFLAVAGEESNSEGMVAAVPFLSKLQDEKKYDYSGAIISECCIPKNRNENIKRIYMGTVGKIMPLFFCVGKETHVGEPLKGLNPNALTSEINKLLEANSDFSDQVNSTVTSPPTCLKQTDLKELYSVQTPLYAAAYYNLLTLNTSEGKLMNKLKLLSLEAFNNVLEDLKQKRDRFMKKSPDKVQYLENKACVMTYGELLEKVKSEVEDFDGCIKTKVDLWKKEKMDNQTIAINIVKETYEKYSNKGPMIIVSFIPPYYPHKYLQGLDEKSISFIEAIDKTIKFAKDDFNENIIKEDFFMGICDLSYTGMNKNKNLNNLSSNIVGYGMNYKLPLEALEKLNIPGIVFGGEGKDFHKYTERLNISYSFNVVPELYKKMIYSILK
ncbi:M20/M25/M40 family metallo-hydrolase [Clostridium sp. PL3]|uniref:M20/M25/M40 family metallo-hydrolase n=1 Tax=Clostridium thailandense TaxID=2794346 RepID=A0A949TLM0_9CLOT|nr:M20/M25/M40 family metallo-hydrolase [Clostridium thailandense]MBV7271557.1 M20/M25/M40 family metallo-hydrolase [Clostridium thailandense]